MWGASKFRLWPLLFLANIKNLQVAIRYFFINKQINYDLRSFNKWLKAQNISLNVGETKLVSFTSPKKQIDCSSKMKLNGKRFYKIFIQIFGNLNWQKNNIKQQINHVTIKLNTANAMPSKLRDVLFMKTLRSFFYAIFESYLYYASSF